MKLYLLSHLLQLTSLHAVINDLLISFLGAPLDLMGRGVLVASSTELAQAMIPYIQHCNYPRDDA